MKVSMQPDEEMLLLDLGTLVKRYPDATHEQLVCLLLLRGDMGRKDATETAAEIVPEAQLGDEAAAGGAGGGGGSGAQSANPLHAKSILSQVQVQYYEVKFMRK